MKKTLRTCPNGHQYYKSSDCPTCPRCEDAAKPSDGFLASLSAPARRALQSRNIGSLKELSTFSEQELLELHGLGPSSIPVLKKFLKEAGMKFRAK